MDWPQRTSGDLSGPRDFIFVTGGFGNDDIVEVFDFQRQAWTPHRMPRAPRGETWCAEVDGVLLALQVDSKKVSCLDPAAGLWTECRPMSVFRRGICLVATGQGLYVMGGTDYGTRCDFYYLRRDTWTQVSNLTNARRWAGAAAFKGRVYCCGGRAEPEDQTLCSVEVYDPAVDLWTRGESMLEPRASHCCVSCPRFLWAVGGWNQASMNDVERFDPVLNTWTRMQSMKCRRNSFSLSVYGHLIYALGGEDDGQHTSSTEVYDSCDDKWTLSAPLFKPRLYHGSCVVRVQENVEEYILL